MRSSSNPVFRNLPAGGYGAPVGFNAGQAGSAYATPQQGYDNYGGTQPGYQQPTAERPMTMDDVVTKTGISIGLALIAGALTYLSGLVVLALPGMIVGLVLSLVIIFRKKVSPALVVGYSIAEGLFLGGATLMFERAFHAPGLALPALAGTFGVFIAMLIVYRTGAIKVTPKLTKWIIGATMGAAVLMLVTLVLSFFGVNTGLRDTGPLGYLFSILVIGIAAFNFLLDFDSTENMIRGGAPAKMAWYAAFGLMTTLVWLYLEVLRLAAMLLGNRD